MDYKDMNAIGIVRLMLTDGVITEEQASKYFPELKESEDEKIRKEIISALNFANVKGVYDKHIAWLEKQGQVKDSAISQHENKTCKENEDSLTSDDENIENDEKVEPKFKQGQWVVDKQGLTHQIERVVENVTTNTFGYDLVGGGYFNDTVNDVRLWSIEDAKDGDILFYENEIFIVKKSVNINILYYCCYDREHFIIDNFYSLTIDDIDNIRPATNGQRDLLFKKMKEAGYEWDADKKELKKIVDEEQIKKNLQDNSFRRMFEQKPWSEENEPLKELAETYLAVFDKHFPILPTLKGKQLADYKNFLNQCQQILGLKYWGIHPTQARLFEKLSLLWAAWGAEHLKGLGQTDGDMDNEKQEWSEEDDEQIETIAMHLDNCGSS